MISKRTMKFKLPLPNKKLKDDVFCVTEERNFFESKMLEQVSEIAALKKQLLKSNREATKLKGELMGESFRNLTLPSALPPKDTVEIDEDGSNSNTSSLTEDKALRSKKKDDRSNVGSQKSVRNDDDSKKSAEEIRRSAEVLLNKADL
mmetsp:Transcript_34243/g.38973  ORF Transcript_34243/g.38973 Transcript_34243/m.38973 type:complete len:148 (-) Transcript_34243:566-1009(-)